MRLWMGILSMFFLVPRCCGGLLSHPSPGCPGENVVPGHGTTRASLPTNYCDILA